MRRILFGVFVTALFAGQVYADALDLTDPADTSSGTINGATFTWIQENPEGTGVLQPFLRIQGNDKEEGYNTIEALDPMDTMNDSWTKPLPFDSIMLYGGSTMRFVLDIDEAGQNDENRYISLDALKIYITDGPIGASNNTPYGSAGELEEEAVTNMGGVKVYDMEEGEYTAVLLDYADNPGNGWGDLEVKVPIEEGDYAGEYVTLYSAFGTYVDDPEDRIFTSDDGFEEWGVDPVPVPAAVLLGFLGLGAAGLKLRKFV